jgi:integrase/recombinase XerD
MLVNVQLKPLWHRGQENIAVYFPHDNQLKNVIKKVAGIRWSQTNRCWYILSNAENFQKLNDALHEMAVVDTNEIKKYIEQKSAFVPASVHSQISKKRAEIIISHPLNNSNLNAFKAFQNMLKLKGYSENTIRTYSNEFEQLLRLLNKVSVNDLTKNHIQSYLLWLLKTKRGSEARVHTAVNAIKFYFEKVEKRAKEFYDLPRPKKPVKLPDILSEQEIILLLNQVKNLKHKSIIMTCYAAGLRVSEVVALKVRDIDSDRMMIHVRQGKGKKDRMVPLSKTLLQTLRLYYKEYKPKDFLFEGEGGGSYRKRSAQKILEEAKKRSRIKKQGSIHMLRHSYATHLLEGGTDIRYIQNFLGHNNIGTTMRYTHVSNFKIESIQSPLDKLKL